MSKKASTNKYAVVTGASKGLGFAYCEELLKLNYNVIGVARDTSALMELQEKYPSLDVQAWNFDLSIFENNKKLFDKAQAFDVEILINNAGYGVWGFFKETDLEQEMNMLDLNIKSLHALTKYFLQLFLEKQAGRILNISSMAAFSPAPVFSSYYASKAYVLSLGTAINTELKKTKAPVRVITLCPGALKTDFWSRSSNRKGAVVKTPVKIMKTSTYARKSLQAGLKTKRKNYLITGLTNKLIIKLNKWIPESWALNSVYKYQKNR
ncbi:SDR family NAD(P)-dependent oxidoreductase [Spiroplasma clarkii]|uniref:Short-chain dehydrogenase/reductase SDR n=1 Tax=Spiroplasma clarkii TaxID=2139 RepID=A0A2K8KFZ2_9MOLU|nr:SDR family NAD(P)-dependent oxidoreductase [Spiroplasma clarkii]ATX70613.1 short-chain dehydrogenase/reductase SDR [Spiroplasma clarkii]